MRFSLWHRHLKFFGVLLPLDPAIMTDQVDVPDLFRKVVLIYGLDC